MNDFTQRIKEKHLRAIHLCAEGTPNVTLPVSAHDFCALIRILYRCFLEEQDYQSVEKTSMEQPAQARLEQGPTRHLFLPQGQHYSAGGVSMKNTLSQIRDAAGRVPTLARRIRWGEDVPQWNS